MKKKIFLITTISVIASLISLCVLSLILFTSSFASVFDYTVQEKVNIVTVFSGIISPIITLASVILLYSTLQEQVKNNKDLELKNQFDLFVLQYNQLDNEYNNLKYFQTSRKTIKGETKETERIYEGYDAFMKICLTYGNNFHFFLRGYGADKIVSIVATYEITDTLIDEMHNNHYIRLYRKKMESFYNLKLRDALRQFCFPIRDEVDKKGATVLFDFFVASERKYHDSEFDIYSYKTVEELFYGKQ